MINLSNEVAAWRTDTDGWSVAPKGLPYILREARLKVGQGVMIGDDVRLSDRVQLGDNVVIHDYASVGRNCVIEEAATIGKRLGVGEGVTIHKFVVISHGRPSFNNPAVTLTTGRAV